MAIGKTDAPSKGGKPPSDADRHKRFVETVKQVGASNNAEDFDDAFKRVVPKKPQKLS
jgi:hypothetical protein